MFAREGYFTMTVAVLFTAIVFTLISREAGKMLSNSDSEIAYNPYGTGDASKKIAEIIQSNL